MYRVLIVDDEEMSRLNLAQLVRMEFPSMELSLASSAREAEVLLNNSGVSFDLLFLDIQMPHQTGLEFLSDLRKNNNDIHVIFVTAYDESEYILQAMRMKAIDYLTKPVKIQELQHAIMEFEKLQNKGNLNRVIETISFAGKIRLPVVEGYRFVEPEKVACFVADGRRSEVIYTDGSKEKIYSSLQSLEETLKAEFIRAGRKYILNQSLIYIFNNKNNMVSLRMEEGELLHLKISGDAVKNLL